MTSNVLTKWLKAFCHQHLSIGVRAPWGDCKWTHLKKLYFSTRIWITEENVSKSSWKWSQFFYFSKALTSDLDHTALKSHICIRNRSDSDNSCRRRAVTADRAFSSFMEKLSDRSRGADDKTHLASLIQVSSHCVLAKCRCCGFKTLPLQVSWTPSQS